MSCTGWLIKKDQKDQNVGLSGWFVLMAGIVGRGRGFPWEFSTGDGPCEPWMPWGLGGEADANRSNSIALRSVTKSSLWQKSGGATYTPKNLADFVARLIIRGTAMTLPYRPPSGQRVLDPAIGRRRAARAGYLRVTCKSMSVPLNYAWPIFGLSAAEQPKALATSPRGKRIRQQWSLLSPPYWSN